MVTLFVLLLLLWLQLTPLCQASISCNETSYCRRTLLQGSECVNGFCTNPFHNGGCLKQMLPGWQNKRICHSDDPPLALANGLCRNSPLDYMEIRVASQNWESAFYGTWIIQILLSELLEIPVSVETGVQGLNVDFYNVNSSFDYGKSSNWDAVKQGSLVGDCRLVKETDPRKYQSCAHVVPENWQDSLKKVTELVQSGILEPPTELGVLAAQYLFVPKFTGERDPTLTSYLGLQGEQNRRKLANRFLRPTTWKDYCQQVSNSTCLAADKAAVRAPIDDKEFNSFYSEGKYTGYFRATEKNDCDKYPTNCTGHFVDYPCDWTNAVWQQIHQLGIALDSEWYTYNQLTQIIAAANATKSDLMIMWYFPDMSYQSYLGTEAEFTHVVFPPPTQECFDNRAYTVNRCVANRTQLWGSPKGKCDHAPQSLQKVIGGSLRKALYKPDTPESLWSPAHQALLNYKITDLQLGEIFKFWKERDLDHWSYDPREATCQWVVNNIDLVKSFIPSSYPRVIVKADVSETSLFLMAIIASSLSTAVILIASAGTFLKRKKKAIYVVQADFLFLLLTGQLLVSVAAMLLALPPTNGTCLSNSWLVNMGYCLVLVPLYVRVDSINRLISTGKQMQRVSLEPARLLGSLFLVSCIVGAFVLVWTIVDVQKNSVAYQLTERKQSTGETIIQATSYCSSDSNLWQLSSVGWQTMLVFISLTLVLMANRVQDGLNDTKVLTLLLLSHFFFVVVRATVVLVFQSTNPSDSMAYQSIAYSLDCLAAVAIYIAPKLLTGSDYKDSSEADPDLFMEATIMFADVTGFTAWSSVREPTQVFKFLEIIYAAFDELAEKRRVFKVETVGDCYVAATGIPHPRSDHVVAMVRFATDCLLRMRKLSHELEVVFGPDTGDLSLRIGIHSGPVTGGFLKGKGARFQLFGDTMNATSQVARSGEKGRIHVSEDTANLLIKSGKTRWVEKRESKVATSGKGAMQTYWLNLSRGGTYPFQSFDDDGASSQNASDANENDLWLISHDEKDVRKRRLIDWNVEVLHKLLKQIVARRNATDTLRMSTIKTRPSVIVKSSDISEKSSSLSYENIDPDDPPSMPLDEVKEIISLPEFDRKIAKRQKDPDSIELSPELLSQLKYYVSALAEMYRENPFHNFAHASHVVMSVLKHMNRIIAPKELALLDEAVRSSNEMAAALHDHTYGITSDPLTQLACVFSALIHDLDHPGVPNMQLIKEDEKLASVYRGRSVAEQNSFDLAWNLLMDEQFNELRTTIGKDNSELARFRQLVINSVMATDLGDKELKALRNGRWEKAFSVDEDGINSASGRRDAVNRKATIVIEHLIQASDVSHTMQHWDIYREWNENLFCEMYEAYRQGRAEKNPADTWYEGEIGFFDYYIIPLSKKLSECGVFGISSDENLNYALKNREEWVARGREVVADMLTKLEGSNSEK